MAKKPQPKSHLNELIDNLSNELDMLISNANDSPLSSHQRKKLEDKITGLSEKLNTCKQQLHPIQLPHFVFDAGNPNIVGRFVALAMIAQPKHPLASVDRFYGSGVYALYYNGSFSTYIPIRASETPIYVGKADPAQPNAKNPMEQEDRLSRRLNDHRRNILKASSSLDIDDFEYRCLVVQSGWQGSAENYLINMFKPVWNSETGICYGFGKHGDDPGTRKNLRSPWDTLHPGREWAHRDSKMKDAKARPTIEAEITDHLGSVTIYTDLDQVLRSFIEELRQL